MVRDQNLFSGSVGWMYAFESPFTLGSLFCILPGLSTQNARIGTKTFGLKLVSAHMKTISEAVHLWLEDSLPQQTRNFAQIAPKLEKMNQDLLQSMK